MMHGPINIRSCTYFCPAEDRENNSVSNFFSYTMENQPRLHLRFCRSMCFEEVVDEYLYDYAESVNRVCRLNTGLLDVKPCRRLGNRPSHLAVPDIFMFLPEQFIQPPF